MTTAQTIFVVALGVIALLVTFLAVYVASSTLWSDRWVRGRRR